MSIAMIFPLLLPPAQAAQVYWAYPPTDTDVADVTRTVPDAHFSELTALMSGGKTLSVVDESALSRLSNELMAVRPLVDVFDGELEIMARLSKALTDVHALRSPEDRDLVWQALMFTGFAVDRYYQDKLGTDPAAAPYRMGEGSLAQVQAWLDASALYGAPRVDERILPEARQRLAFDNLQAFARGMPSAAFVVGKPSLGQLAEGAEVRIDGMVVEPGTKLSVTPGRHFWQVRVGNVDLLHEDMRILPGSDIPVVAPVGPKELDALRQVIAGKQAGWEVPAAIRWVVDQVRKDDPGAVYIAVPGESLKLYRIDAGRAEATRIVPDDSDRDKLVFGITLGAGWSSTGDWLLQNRDENSLQDSENPPIERSTVNATTPALSVGAEWRPVRLYSLGAGFNMMLPLGEWHTLPTGESTLRPFFYPHIATGLPWVQATLGPLFPWYLGVGLKAHVPLKGPLGLEGHAVYGAGIPQARENGPTFEPLPYWNAWAGLSFQLGV